jgi:hypothetical protein
MFVGHDQIHSIEYIEVYRDVVASVQSRMISPMPELRVDFRKQLNATEVNPASD